MSRFTVWFATPDSPMSVVSYTVQAKTDDDAIVKAEGLAKRDDIRIEAVDNVVEK